MYEVVDFKKLNKILYKTVIGDFNATEYKLSIKVNGTIFCLRMPVETTSYEKN